MKKILVMILALLFLPVLAIGQETVNLGDKWDGDRFNVQWVYSWTTTTDCYRFTGDYFRYYGGKWNWVNRYDETGWSCPGPGSYVTVEIVDETHTVPVFGDTVFPENKDIMWTIWHGNYGTESTYLVYKNWLWAYRGGCTNECSPSGSEQCYTEGGKDYIRYCSNYDADPCLEWSPPGYRFECPSGTTCVMEGGMAKCKGEEKPTGTLELIFLLLKQLVGG